MADNTASAAEHAASPAKPRLSADTKWIVWIVTTVIGIGLLQLTLVGMMFQQNAMLMPQYATVNARIDDTNASVTATQTDIRELRAEMHAMRAELRTEMHAMRAELQAEIRERHAETQTDIRELRGMLLQLLERTAPANPVN